MAKPSSGYVKPVVGEERRLDQGIDFKGTPGDHVVAMGLARVVAIKSDPGGFGTAIYYKLLDGPARGREVYVGHAQPTVRVGQIVQAGDPVATLLDHGLGNASGLAGWTEVGFAKNGVPDPGTAKEFKALVDGATPAPPVQPAAQSPVDTSGSQDTSVTPPVAGQDPNLGLQPDALSTRPLQPPPGSGMTSTNSYLADLWNRIASQPGSSPETLAFAQNAQTAGG